jgi:hypothetical protein
MVAASEIASHARTAKVPASCRKVAAGMAATTETAAVTAG